MLGIIGWSGRGNLAMKRPPPHLPYSALQLLLYPPHLRSRETSIYSTHPTLNPPTSFLLPLFHPSRHSHPHKSSKPHTRSSPSSLSPVLPFMPFSRPLTSLLLRRYGSAV